MFKVIIADDEKIIQEGLTESIEWEKLGFQIVGCFSDGRDVIEYLNSAPVDVVITDIVMNHIDGIEIAKHVQSMGLPCKVVFISGYNDFELARQAVKYGVIEYVLKPIQLEEVSSLLKKIKNELDRNIADDEFRRKQEEHKSKLLLVMKEQFFNSLILGGLDDPREITEKISFLLPGCDLQSSPCMLLDVQINDIEETVEANWNSSLELFFDCLYRLLDEDWNNGLLHVLYRNKDKMRLFVFLQSHCDSLQSAQEQCDSYATSFKTRLSEQLKITVSVTVKRVFRNIQKATELRELLLKDSSELYDKDVLLQEQKKLIVSNILSGNIGVSQKVLSEIIKSLAVEDIRYSRNVVVDIFACINEALWENNPKLYRAIHSYTDYHIILNLQSPADIERYCIRLFDRLKDKGGNGEKFENGALINQVKKYVCSHIFENILLEDIGNEVYFSVSHLRRVFKRETGETFLQYVIRKKMEKAVELLHDPKYKVYQISEMLGYKSTRYFSKLFYSNIGCFPGEYRKNVLHMSEVSDEE